MTRKLKTLVCAAPLVAVLLSAPVATAAGVSGAIFTTVVDGTIVNANTQYTSKCDVYLDGGPGPHAPSTAAGLPAGDYYFQVTDPSGQTLLSADPVANRRFTVNSSGVISAYTGSHATGLDQDHFQQGAITIGLANGACPTSDFKDSPNGGGVYKVWVTPVGSFVGDSSLVDNPCSGSCSHGFVHSQSKTDNFKINNNPTQATFSLTVIKQIINADGSISPGFNWPMHLVDSSTGTTNNFFTNSTDGSVTIGPLVAGTYTVSEDILTGFSNIGLKVNGLTLPQQPTYSFFWNTGSPNPFVIVFQNQGSGIF